MCTGGVLPLIPNVICSSLRNQTQCLTDYWRCHSIDSIWIWINLFLSRLVDRSASIKVWLNWNLCFISCAFRFVANRLLINFSFNVLVFARLLMLIRIKNSWDRTFSVVLSMCRFLFLFRQVSFSCLFIQSTMLENSISLWIVALRVFFFLFLSFWCHKKKLL